MTAGIPQPSSRLLVVGQSGSGKSTRVKELIRSWLNKGVRVVALDPGDEYSRHGVQTGLVRLGPLKHRLTAAELAANPRALLAPRLSLSVVPGPTVREWARAFELLAGLVRHAGRLVVVADEVGTWCHAATHPACSRAAAELSALATTGRHQGIALVVISQRAATVPATVRSQCTDAILFRQEELADLEALAARWRNDSLPARLPSLADGEAIELLRTIRPAAPSPPSPAASAVN